MSADAREADGPDVIEADYKEMPAEPRPCPEPPPLAREDVLGAARTLAARVTGLAAAVEQAALAPDRVRPEFLKAWRAWAGAFLADAQRLERSIFKEQVEAGRVAGYARRLAEWQRALAAELGGAQAGAAAPAEPEADKAPWSAAPRRWPWFVWMPVGAGALFGAYMSVRWVFRKCLEAVNDSGDREQEGRAE